MILNDLDKARREMRLSSTSDSFVEVVGPTLRTWAEQEDLWDYRLDNLDNYRALVDRLTNCFQIIRKGEVVEGVLYKQMDGRVIYYRPLYKNGLQSSWDSFELSANLRAALLKLSEDSSSEDPHHPLMS